MAAAADRLYVTRVTQDMLVEVWKAYIDDFKVAESDDDGAQIELLELLTKAQEDFDPFELEHEDVNPWEEDIDINGCLVQAPTNAAEPGCASNGEPPSKKLRTDRTECIALDENNKVDDGKTYAETIASIKTDFPHYSWPAQREANPNDDVSLPLDMDMSRAPAVFRSIRGICYSTADGNKHVARLDSSAIEYILKWWAQLRWTCKAQEVGQLAQRRRSRVTFVELAIDLFLTTGAQPSSKSHPLAVQARALGKALRQLVTDFCLLLDFRRVHLKQALEPMKVNALQPLLALSSLDGLSRRPLWSQARTEQIATHVLLAAQQDIVDFGAASTSDEVGRAYFLRAHGVQAAITVDHVARTWDSILALSAKVPVAPRIADDPTHGPCVRGHVSTARHGSRQPWWHRVVDGIGTDLEPGNTICHACYLALRKHARNVARSLPCDDRPPDSLGQ